MRMPDCKECSNLKTLKDIKVIRNKDYWIKFSDAQRIAVRWWKHFNSKPNLMNMASCRTIVDLFNLKEEDIEWKR